MYKYTHSYLIYAYTFNNLYFCNNAQYVINIKKLTCRFYYSLQWLVKFSGVTHVTTVTADIKYFNFFQTIEIVFVFRKS